MYNLKFIISYFGFSRQTEHLLISDFKQLNISLDKVYKYSNKWYTNTNKVRIWTDLLSLFRPKY